MPIYIRGEDEETLAKLKDMGFDAQIVTDDPMGDAIFYLARMNAKLDNLGQLRHLHKLMQSTLKIKSAAESQDLYYARLNAEYEHKQARLRLIYTRMKELTDLPQNDQWRKGVPTFAMLHPLTEADVFRAFQCKADENYTVTAIEYGAVYIKGAAGEPVLLGTGRNGEPTIRIMDI